MVRKITIGNYKSIDHIVLNLGRVNIFIGENGCGKSNILEAIALGAAAAKGKLDNEFLLNRGIRVTEPKLMRSAFATKNSTKEIQLAFEGSNGKSANFNLSNDNKPYSKWIDVIHLDLKPEDAKKRAATIERKILVSVLKDILEEKDKIGEKIKESFKDTLIKLQENNAGSETCKSFEEFLIFTPEYSYLRNFEAEGQIEPLGRKGEGLFKLLKTYFIDRNKKKIDELINNLSLFEWFSNMNLPSDLLSSENRLTIKDKYIFSKISETFDQRSLSEGFLYILFYVSLLISENTPNFFAIENIENALNPKLCSKITKNVVELSKKYNKQIILTTHNPAVLDGLNLDDPEQKLFVIYRNADGHTIYKNYEKPKPIEGVPLVKLSESFLRGYIGGLPNNF